MSELVFTVDAIGDGALTNSLIDRSVTEVIDENCTALGKNCLSGATQLKKIHFENVTSVSSDVCLSCTMLESISFPKVTYLGSCSFAGLTSLKEIHMPKLSSISKQYAFQGCTSLKKVDLPKLGFMGVGASYSCGIFNECTALDTFILRNETVCKLDNTSALASTPIRRGNGYVYVPAALLESYEADQFWGNMNIQFRAIEDYPDICGG